MVQYDSSVIEHYAKVLYERARLYVLLYGIAGAVAGFSATVLMITLLGTRGDVSPFMVGIGGGLFGALVGGLKGPALRLEPSVRCVRSRSRGTCAPCDHRKSTRPTKQAHPLKARTFATLSSRPMYLETCRPARFALNANQ